MEEHKPKHQDKREEQRASDDRHRSVGTIPHIQGGNVAFCSVHPAMELKT